MTKLELQVEWTAPLTYYFTLEDLLSVFWACIPPQKLTSGRPDTRVTSGSTLITSIQDTSQLFGQSSKRLNHLTEERGTGEKSNHYPCLTVGAPAFHFPNFEKKFSLQASRVARFADWHLMDSFRGARTKSCFTQRKSSRNSSQRSRTVKWEVLLHSRGVLGRSQGGK